MPLCKPKVLLQEGSFCVAQCKHCQRLSILYHNVLAGFSPSAFTRFSENVIQTSFQEYSVQFPVGEPYIILQTCHQDIQFTFNKKEFKQLKRGLAEVMVLLEAQQILDSNR
uniref:Uncharacterized protein n=1 Tax=Roseihalotalea indica TaxID=2867963 RepID=A0AA49GPN5_9BACT|nr:hypothetical protein K4G66_21470 [Tunicatimonas sp. TK19036]